MSRLSVGLPFLDSCEHLALPLVVNCTRDWKELLGGWCELWMSENALFLVYKGIFILLLLSFLLVTFINFLTWLFRFLSLKQQLDLTWCQVLFCSRLDPRSPDGETCRWQGSLSHHPVPWLRVRRPEWCSKAQSWQSEQWASSHCSCPQLRAEIQFQKALTLSWIFLGLRPL